MPSAQSLLDVPEFLIILSLKIIASLGSIDQLQDVSGCMGHKNTIRI